MILNRQSLQAFVPATDTPRQVKTVDAPELGEDAQFCIRMLTAAERTQIDFDDTYDRSKKRSSLRARMVQATLCDPDGRLVYGKEDLALIGSLPYGVVDLIYYHALEFSGLTDDAREDAEKKSVNQMTNNTSTTLPTGSASPSLNLLNPSAVSN